MSCCPALRRLLLVVSCAWLGACGERPLEPRDPTPGVPHYRFVTYNIAFPKAGDGDTLGAVGETHGDVIALQETNAAWRDALTERYSEEYPYMLFKALDGPEGLGVLSRFPLVDEGFLPGPEDWHPAWHVRVETPAGPVQILNVHLRALFDGSGDPVSSYFQTGGDHLYEMKQFLSQCEPALPSIVLGDFNEGVDGQAINYLEDHGFDNALPLYHPGQPTWHMSSVADQMQMTIDHVLFDSSFAPLNAYVLDTGNSDHWPVVAHLETRWVTPRAPVRARARE